ncbi:MAG: hypothetical protein IAF02_06550, partial [Anaerolineae bacterium]|nr:hypothetical protein [Anaerolineae bacterium]
KETPSVPPTKPPQAESLEEDEALDWLGELEPPKTALLGQSDESEESPREPDLDDGDLPDWLIPDTESPELETASTMDDIFSDSNLFEEDVPDWMLSDEQPAASQQAQKPVQEDMLDDFTLDEAASKSLTGWLAEFDTEEDDEEETAVSLPEAPVQEVEVKRSLTDWLTAFDEEDLVPDDAPSQTAQQEADEESLPDWLTGIDEATEAAATAHIGKSASETAPEADDSFDWLSDLDELEEATTGSGKLVLEEPEETGEALDDWLTVDITSDPSLATGDTGPLPDWLDDLEPATTAAPSPVDSTDLDSTLEDLFGETPKSATGELDWLDDVVDEEPTIESKSDKSSLAPLVSAAGAAALFDAMSQDDEDTPADDPDWLSELAAFDPNEIVTNVAEETAVFVPTSDESDDEYDSDFDVEAIFEATESAELDNFDIDDELLGIDEHTARDWADIDGILAGTADDEALPEWLEQLDDIPSTELEILDTENAPPEEIPDWVASMRPSDTGQLASVLPSALFSESDASDLLDDTTDLADAELPDWLDESVDKRVATAKSFSGWFDSDGDLEDAPAELEAILADLPPAQAPEDMLQKAEIPAWLEELKPRELTGAAPALTESRLESTGPLAGMPNTIAIEPIIAMPRSASTPGSYTVSPEQMQQARLLRQLVQEGPTPPQVREAAISARSLAGLRILVALLLLAAVFIGLYGPSFVKSKSPAGVPVPAAAFNTAVADAAGKTVLVAFDYTPAFAGELNPEAEMLLAQIDAAGSPILTTSQYVAGTAVAEAMTAPYNTTSLGLIPGEAMGLRQLSGCLGENALIPICTSLHNRTLNAATASALADVGLIVVLTGERSSLVNWVEQAGAGSDLPIVIGTTQSLEPVVVPYFASAQVAGYLNGLPATIAYQHAYTDMQNTSSEILYDAQSFVLLVTAVILLIGGLVFGSRKKKA